ncbi:MAG: FAD/NAD(P)-binding protein [Candidatus Eremiobacteraeota bacterium]|nr:FAD/NAD(P)-binding protein [Candidatus Eremiobacteraeota bacterium]
MGFVRSCDTAIVGAGASGSAALLALAQNAGSFERVILFDSNRPGPGTAYRDEQADSLLMNGPARSMSIVAGDDGHLIRWLGGGSPDRLISRKRYGSYLAQTIQRALERRPAFAHNAAEIIDVESIAEGYVLTDRAGIQYGARNVILALGNHLPANAALPDSVRTHPAYHADPWRLGSTQPLGAVAIVGTGLTAMDVATQFFERGFHAPIYMISRRGILPAVENPAVRGLPSVTLELDVRSPYQLLRSVRRSVLEHESQGGDWRSIVESVRELAPQIWMGWPERERRRFIRHLQSQWVTHRYRVPPATHQTCRKLIENGQLKLVAGRVTGARPIGANTLRMTITGRDSTMHIDAGAVVNATGPNLDYETIAHPLVRNASSRGLIRADSLRLGLDVTSGLRCISAAGTAAEGLFALGPPARGRFYESTAIPEIRAHAQIIAKTIRSQDSLVVLGAVS